MIAAGDPSHDDADRRQAEYYCGVFHAEIDSLDRQIRNLRATIRRHTSVRALHHHLSQTELDLKSLLIEREQVGDMLAALGHAHPCLRDHRSAGSTPTVG